MNKNPVRIASVDAKDLYIANHLVQKDPLGYSLFYAGGDVNMKKFINTLDFSLDLIKMREVYEKVYRNKGFSFINNGYEFSQRCINVTFKYSNKEFNRFGKNLYVKFGYRVQDIQLENESYVKNGELIAIVIDKQISEDQALPPNILGRNFKYEDGKYILKSNKTLHTVADLRNDLYENGFYCDGVHYVRFKRSSGSSRVGKCLFIDEKLYPAMHKYELLGLKPRKGQVIDLAALEAYIALTLSSIVDVIHINPKSILVIDDYESIFKDRVIATRIKDKKLVTKEETVEIKNSIWDGQSLIDISAMGEYSKYGMILLRNSFFKSCCFNTNIQKFFKDNGITQLSQLNGTTMASSVEDIRLITTPNSIKFLKFGTLEQWLTRIDSTFGVVKHEKKTHFFEGDMVQSHYQLINTLQLSKTEVAKLLAPTFDYMDKLKTDPAVMRYHIHYPKEHKLRNTPLNSKNDIVFRMMGINEDFCKTVWYSEFRKKNILAYKNNLRYGHVLVNGNYSTLLGNPLEMLKASIGAFDGTSSLQPGQIHSKRFEYNKMLLGSRSPHVLLSNILLTTNVENQDLDTYFNTTPEIVCINSINENILQRLSGCDFDSDTTLLTDNEIMIRAALRNYDKFLVPTNFVESKKSKRYFTSTQKADLDIKTSVNKIGDIINLSQELQSYLWDQLNHGASYEDVKELYYDLCQLDVMSGLEIGLNQSRRMVTCGKINTLNCWKFLKATELQHNRKR